jgi:hypothetical protein
MCIENAEKMGATCITRPTSKACADLKNMIFTAPAFMKETGDFHEIYKSVDALVKSVDDGLVEWRKKKDEAKVAKKEKKAVKAAKKKAKKEQPAEAAQ